NSNKCPRLSKSRSSLTIHTLSTLEEEEGESSKKAGMPKAVTTIALKELEKLGCIDPNTNNYVNIKKPSIPKPKNCIEYLKWSNFLNHLLIPIYHDIALKLTWPMTKKVLKAAVAYWLAFLIVLTVPVMKTIGTGTFLAIVMVCYFQPSGTFGSLAE
ncbi:16648_t:CDS:2, partial [Entrophospora sp. SA101]